MAKLTDNDWLEIQARYELGHTLRKIADEYGTSASTISRRATSENWQISNSLQQAVQVVASDLGELQQKTQHMQQSQLDVVFDEVVRLSGIKQRASEVQESMLDLIKLASAQAKKLLQDNPSGLHVKSQGENGSTFGRNTEFVKDLIPAMTAANAILGIGKEQPTTAIQINNENKIEDKVVINIEGV